MNVCGSNYLGVITSTERVGVLNNANINKITGVKLFPFGVSDKLRSDTLLFG